MAGACSFADVQSVSERVGSNEEEGGDWLMAVGEEDD